MNPTFCLPIEKGMLIFCIIDMIYAVANFGLPGWLWYVNFRDERHPYYDHRTKWYDWVLTTLLCVDCVMRLMSSVGLFLKGYRKRDRNECKAWMITVCMYLPFMYAVMSKPPAFWWALGYSIVSLYMWYGIWIVWEFRKWVEQNDKPVAAITLNIPDPSASPSTENPEDSVLKMEGKIFESENEPTPV